MKELSIDISKHTFDHINDYLNMGINILITVCDNANNGCPIFPEDVKHLHWIIDDPSRN